MHDAAFDRWLAAKSWALGVRYCRAVIFLLLPAAAAMDLLVLLGDAAAAAKLPSLLAWQACVLAASGAVLGTDRWCPRLRGREDVLYAFCGVFMVLVTWVGITAILLDGSGLVIYAAGSTFIAASICTPRPVRTPMYVASLAGLGAAAWLRTGEPLLVAKTLINPCCVAVLCIALDRLSLHRNLELYRERQRAETQRARADQLLANVLPARVVDEIKHAGRATARRIDNLGVLFADIVGFTRYASELPPQAVVLVLDEIFCAFDELAQRHGVEKIKTIGDAYMAVSESGAAALCRVALEMRQALERYNAANGTRLSMRIGIHAGPAVAGVLGVQRFLYDVWGDTVNVASRLEGGSQPGSIQVSEPVVRQAGREFSFTARGPVELEGRGSMNTWWLLGTAEAARRPLLSVVGAA